MVTLNWWIVLGLGTGIFMGFFFDGHGESMVSWGIESTHAGFSQSRWFLGCSLSGYWPRIYYGQWGKKWMILICKKSNGTIVTLSHGNSLGIIDIQGLRLADDPCSEATKPRGSPDFPGWWHVMTTLMGTRRACSSFQYSSRFTLQKIHSDCGSLIVIADLFHSTSTLIVIYSTLQKPWISHIHWRTSSPLHSGWLAPVGRPIASSEKNPRYHRKKKQPSHCCQYIPIGSMVLLYMVAWIPSIYPLYVSIYTTHGSYGINCWLATSHYFVVESWDHPCTFHWICRGFAIEEEEQQQLLRELLAASQGSWRETWRASVFGRSSWFFMDLLFPVCRCICMYVYNIHIVFYYQWLCAIMCKYIYIYIYIHTLQKYMLKTIAAIICSINVWMRYHLI